jgi:purine-nucleoside phosphorylase
MDLREKTIETAGFLKRKGIVNPETGIILGTGLGSLVHSMQIAVTISYRDIPHFPVSTVEFHDGKLVYGLLNGKKVIAMQGRFHFYEGYSMPQIYFPVVVMKHLGIKQLLISNACGAMNKSFSKGQLMQITDQINLLGFIPFPEKLIENEKVATKSHTSPYSGRINELIERIAKRYEIHLNKGVYAAVPGPCLETRAEYRYLSIIGADVVGMSTIPEALAAWYLNLPVAAVSVITDECDPDNLQPINISEILEVAASAEKLLKKIFFDLVGEL